MEDKMTDHSYYHCQHCRTDVCVEIKCPCCSLGNPESAPHSIGESLFDDFFAWLKVHTSGIKMRIDAMDWEIDRGYVKACEVIEAELRRKLEEHKDGSDRITGNQGTVGEQVS
jgi:hypothetical protein